MTMQHYEYAAAPGNGAAQQQLATYGHQNVASGAVQRPSDVDSWTSVLTATAQLAEQICNTDFVPLAMRGNPAAVTATMLTGRELGIGPMTSLAHIHIVKGKPGQSAQLMRQLVQAAGHFLRYVETTDTRCIVEGRRRGEDQWERVTFTADQARKARIDLGGYPEDKLVARATSRLCRRKFADCLGGMAYTIEELEDGGFDDSPEPAAPSAPTARRTAQRRTPPRSGPATTAAPAEEQEPPGGPPLPGEPGYTEDPTEQPAEEPPITKPQLTKLHTIFSNGGIEDREVRLQACCLIVGRDLESSKDLTKDEATRLIDKLEELDGGDVGLAEVIDELIGRTDAPARGDQS